MFVPHKFHPCSKSTIYAQIIKSKAMIGIEIFKYRGHTVLGITLMKIWKYSAFNEVLIYLLLLSQLNIGHRISTKVLLIYKFWVHIRNLHAGINLDFNLQCIYTIFGGVTVIVKFVQVAEIHITIWVTSKSYSNDVEFILGYEI